MAKKVHEQKFEMEIDDKVYKALSKALEVLEENPKLKKEMKV